MNRARLKRSICKTFVGAGIGLATGAAVVEISRWSVVKIDFTVLAALGIVCALASMAPIKTPFKDNDDPEDDDSKASP